MNETESREWPHQPVMPEEILEALQPEPGKIFIDGTLGAGGHSELLLEKSSPTGTVTAFDLDPEAIAIAGKRLERYKDRIRIIQDSYTEVKKYLNNKENFADGFLLDLGVSSMQIDESERGFSFLKDGPLDMRFSPKQVMTAYDFINEMEEDEIARVLFEYGEERNSRRIASAICRERKTAPIRTTTQLAHVIETVSRNPKEKIHPATRSFQAIRIAVNGEMDAIRDVLPTAIDVLKPGGRLAVISFHSLEDRIVKQFFQRESRDCICPPEQLICTCGHKASIKEITKHPVTAAEDEISRNFRSRSAKLRVAEKL